MSKLAKVLLACAVALVLLVVGSVVVREQQVRASTEMNCKAVAGWVASRGAFVVSGDGPKIVAVLGDSYTAGEKLADRSAGWAFDLAKDSARTIYADGIGSTGFTNGGFCGDQAFETRVTAIKDLRPDVLIIQGGLNDTEAEPAEVTAAAGELLDSVADIPNVVLVGPANAPARAGVDDIDAAISEAAVDHARPYVSTLGWHLPFLPDKLHLTEEGHATFAENVEAALTGFGLEP